MLTLVSVVASALVALMAVLFAVMVVALPLAALCGR